MLGPGRQQPTTVDVTLRATVIASTGPWSTVVMGILATDS